MIIRDNQTNQKIAIEEAPDQLVYVRENKNAFRITRKPHAGQWIYKSDNPGLDLETHVRRGVE